MKAFLKLMICLFVLKFSNAQDLKIAGGSIQRFPAFSSAYVEPRNIDVWLPDGYNPQKKYAVLYMHDGQMLFDSSNTWVKQEWGVDETMTTLLAQKKIKDCIVVGIWNSGANRHADYFPQKPFESLSKQVQDSIYAATRNKDFSLFASPVHSDLYLQFIVTELKPFIDSKFSTLKDRHNTLIAGSSMGGLISMYAICEYPEVFGAAACLSTHWPGLFSDINNPVPAQFLSYLEQHLPDPATHRLYFDYGSLTLDSLYKPHQLKADQILKKRGYSAKNWLTMEFPGANHSENAWKKRLAIPIVFLLKL